MTESDHDAIVELKTIMNDVKKDIKEIHDKLLGKDGICFTVNQHKTYFKIIGVTLIIVIPIIGGIIWDLIH